jgi:RNA polymerase sigma-70 factor (ECF subfamily)
MSQTMTLPTEDFIPTRYSLLSRLQNWDDHDSWKDFFDTYWRLIYAVALKSGLTEAEAQEVVQETIIAVAKNIQKFKRDRQLGSFKGWLRNLTRWRIADQLRKRTRVGSGETEVDGNDDSSLDAAEIPVSAEAESVWEDEWRVNLMKVALENVRGRVKEEHYQMFDFYVVKQWPVAKVARTLGVSAGQVYLAKFRVGALIKKEIRRLETREIQLE